METCLVSQWFLNQDWIIPIELVDEYSMALHDNINEMICEHNWRLNEILSLPIGLREYHKRLVNERVNRKNDQQK